VHSPSPYGAPIFSRRAIPPDFPKKIMKVNPKKFPHIILIAYIVGVIIAILLGFIPKHEGGEALVVPLTGVGFMRTSSIFILSPLEDQVL